MQIGVMITNGPGGHPSWKHAEVTAEQLVIDPKPEAENYAEKVEAAALLRHQLKTELEAHHEKVKHHELGKLKEHGLARHDHPLEPEDEHLDDAIATVLRLTKGTILEAHYARPEVQEAMRHVIAIHFRTQQHIHRSEHLAQHKQGA